MICITIKLSILLIVLHLLLKAFIKMTTKWCTSQICLKGKTAVITGANTGIGYETALEFAKRGARVILACRDSTRGEKARMKIIEATDNTNVIVKIIDMASLESVRKFVKDITSSENRIDILVNNAAVLGVGDKKSVDGHDLTMQVNYFSSFLLSNLLIDLLKKSKPSRIINVSSCSASNASFTLDLDKFVENFSNYELSKLCNILFTIELARRLEGTGITAYSLHPGVIKTEIMRYSGSFLKIASDIFFALYGKTAEEGAQTTIHCALTKGIEDYSGGFFSNCQRKLFASSTNDLENAQQLWKLSEKIVL